MIARVTLIGTGGAADVGGANAGGECVDEDLDLALNVAQRLRVGAVMVDDTSDFRIDAMPFGGPRRSGIGREGVRYAVEAMTEPTIVVIHRQPSPRPLAALRWRDGAR